MAEKITRQKEIPKKKLASIEELRKLIKDSVSITFVSIKDLPTSQFQLIKKKLRGKAVTKVIKKNMLIKAFEDSQKGTLQRFKGYFKEDMAIIFSELDAFELSAILSKNKSMSKAKIGQAVNEDIVIEPGPTELVPGPVISELSALGIKFAIEDGKINIKEKKAILKAGEKVNEQAASIMGKLGMKPVAVGLEPVVAYDAREDKIYENIAIDSEKTLKELKEASGKSLAFAVKVAYACKETIKYLLGKALSHEKALDKLIKADVQENKQEEKVQNKEIKSGEEK